MILIVDHDPEVGGLLRALFRAVGEAVEWTRDGERAIDLVRALRPVVVVLDVTTSTRMGMAALRALRADADRALAATPVLVYSTARDGASRRDALAAGASDYVVKGDEVFDLRRRVLDLFPADRAGARRPPPAPA